MSELIPETLIDIIIIIVSSFVILGVLGSHIDFKVKVNEHMEERKTINFGEAIAGSPCFSEYVNNDMKKGVFEKEKLDGAISGNNPCKLEYRDNYFIEIIDEKNEWKFGDESVKEKEKTRTKTLKCCRYMKTPQSIESFYVASMCSVDDVEILNPDNIRKHCPSISGQFFKSYPIAIKYSENEIIPAHIIIYLSD